jgi:hypothetical protein
MQRDREAHFVRATNEWRRCEEKKDLAAQGDGSSGGVKGERTKATGDAWWRSEKAETTMKTGCMK